jgi:hypothetical protein
MHNLRHRPGFNPTPAGDASAISDTPRQTTGAASNRSVVTSDIQCSMPNLRLELTELKNELLELSPQDPLFDEPVMKESSFDNLSLSSSASTELKALFKDTAKRALCCSSSALLSLSTVSPRRQVEAPGSHPPMKEVLVLPRHRANSPIGPASLCGREREEWVQRRPTSLVV